MGQRNKRMPVVFGERVCQARGIARLTQNELKDLLGVKAISTVSKWERGETFPDDVGTIEKISSVLKKPVWWFFMTEDESRKVLHRGLSKTVSTLATA